MFTAFSFGVPALAGPGEARKRDGALTGEQIQGPTIALELPTNQCQFVKFVSRLLNLFRL